MYFLKIKSNKIKIDFFLPQIADALHFKAIADIDDFRTEIFF
jgi:hypothetical protein